MKKEMKQQLVMLSLALIILILTAGVIIFRSVSPMASAKRQSVKVAKEVAGIKSVQDFYWFSREKSYFTVVGKDDKNDEKVVFLPEDGTEAVIMDYSSGINSNDAIKKVLELAQTKSIKKVSLGLYNNQPVWEVVAQNKEKGINYYLVAFKDGEIINTIINN